MTEKITIKAGEGDSESDLRPRVAGACKQMEGTYEGGCYSKITVLRHWSKHKEVEPVDR